MALNKTALKNALIALYDDCDEDMTSDTFADRMSSLIDDYVKGATVKITANQSMIVATPPVQTLTALANGGGPVLGSIVTPAVGYEWTGTLT
jgi:hypothetical protein